MLRPINFLIIFLFCLGLVLFSLENTEPAVIKIINGVDIEAPLCIELIVTMGLGAIFAWMFSVWNRLLRSLSARKLNRELQQKNNRIQQLEKDLEQYKVETTSDNPQLPASSEKLAEDTQTTQALAQR